MDKNSCDIDSLLKLSVMDRKLEGVLQIKPTDRPEIIDAPTLLAYLEGAGVQVRAINNNAIDKLVQSIQDDPSHTHTECVARGTTPQKGRDAEIRFESSIQKRLDAIKSRQCAFDAASANGTLTPSSESEDAEAIDFYTLSPFLIVEKGDKICTIIPSADGSDGIDIFGQSIPSPDGKENTKIIDKSLQITEGVVTSKIAGRLIINGNDICVTPELEIQENVDFSTANIYFPGDVTVNGGVMDNFVVQSQGSICIRKLVQSATIKADKNITLNQGVAGKDVGNLVAQENLHAGYLESAIATVGGDCTVDHEITNSKITITGELKAPNAPLRGGELSVAKKTELSAIGSTQGIETTLILGYIPKIADLIKKTLDMTAQLEKDIEKKQNNLEKFSQSIGKPTASQIEEQMGMEFEISELRSKSSMLETAMQKIMQAQHAQTCTSLTVSRAIYAKSIIYIPGHKVVFEQDLEGLSTLELPNRGQPTIELQGTRRPLKEVAKVYPDQRIPRVEHHDDNYNLAA